MAAPEFGRGGNITPTDDELRKQEEAGREASELLTALREKQGNKALVLVVDDMRIKREDAKEELSRSSAANDISYVLSLKPNGESAVRLYEAFRKQEPQDQRNNVVVMLDGNLKDKTGIYNFSSQVAEKLMELSTANGWEAPYLIGISNTPNENRRLEQAYQQNYIPSVNGIASKLSPPQKPSAK